MADRAGAESSGTSEVPAERKDVAVRMSSKKWVGVLALLAGCGASTFVPVDADGGAELGPVVVAAGGGAGGGSGGAMGGGAGGGTGGGAQCADTWASYGSDFFTTWCVNCHASLGRQSVVQNNAQLIRSYIASGSMPQGGGLTAAEVARVEAYLDCGAP